MRKSVRPFCTPHDPNAVKPHEPSSVDPPVLKTESPERLSPLVVLLVFGFSFFTLRNDIVYILFAAVIELVEAWPR